MASRGSARITLVTSGEIRGSAATATLVYLSMLVDREKGMVGAMTSLKLGRRLAPKQAGRVLAPTCRPQSWTAVAPFRTPLPEGTLEWRTLIGKADLLYQLDQLRKEVR